MLRNPLLAFVASMAVTQLAIFITTVWLHRSLAHKALSVSAGLGTGLRILTWVTTGIRPRQWVAVHRRHHAHTDIEGDPHSPVLLGFWAVQLGNVVLYKRAAANREMVARYAKDLPADRWDRILFDHALVGLGIGMVLLMVVFGPWLGLLAGLLHAVSYLMLSAAVNAVGHSFGRRPVADLHSGNCQWLAFLTAGEGLHNNHHALPTSARLALARREIDPGWWLIAALQRLGWASVRHQRVPHRTPVSA